MLRPYDSTGALEYYRNNWAPFNILNEYRSNYMDIGVLDLKGQAELAYTPVKALELRGLVSLRRASTGISHYITEGSDVSRQTIPSDLASTISSYSALPRYVRQTERAILSRAMGYSMTEAIRSISIL